MSQGIESGDGRSLYEALLNLVPDYLRHDPGEVFYSGATSFASPSPLYLLGFNPGGDPTKDALDRFTIGADLEAARGPDRQDWSAFEDDWRVFGPGAVAFQRRVRHLIEKCGIATPRAFPASNAIFVRSSRVATLGPTRAESLLRHCWAVHGRVISELDVHVVVCLGQDSGRWVRVQLEAVTEPPIDFFFEDNGRRWRSTTHRGRDGIQVVTLAHPSVADWCNPKTDPTGLVVRALARGRS